MEWNTELSVAWMVSREGSMFPLPVDCCVRGGTSVRRPHLTMEESILGTLRDRTFQEERSLSRDPGA